MFCIFFKKFLFLKNTKSQQYHSSTHVLPIVSRIRKYYECFQFSPLLPIYQLSPRPVKSSTNSRGGVGGKLWRFTKDSTTIFFHFLRFLPHKQTCTSEIWKSRFDSLMKGKNRKLIEKEKRKRIRNIFFLFIYIFSIRQSEFELRTTTKNPIIFCFNYFCIKQFVWNFVRWRKTILKR